MIASAEVRQAMPGYLRQRSRYDAMLRVMEAPITEEQRRDMAEAIWHFYEDAEWPA